MPQMRMCHNSSDPHPNAQPETFCDCSFAKPGHLSLFSASLGRPLRTLPLVKNIKTSECSKVYRRKGLGYNKVKDTMAKQITDIKQFLELTRRADVTSASIKVNKKVNAKGKVVKQTKFKVRGSRYLYTLIVADEDKAKKLQQALPSNLDVTQI